MLIVEAIIGYVCFLIINFVYDTYVKKGKSSFSRLGIVSLIQTAIAIGIYCIV